MDVLNRLAGLRASVKHHPVAGVGDTFRNCHLPGMGDQVSEQVIPGRAELTQVGVVGARNHKYMNGSLRIYIAKSDCPRIRGNYRRRYLACRDTTEQAIWHRGILTSATPATSGTYMVAMLRTRGAAPLVHSHATSWPCVPQGLVLRTCSRMAGGCGGNGSGLGSQVWRRCVATLAYDRE